MAAASDTQIKHSQRLWLYLYCGAVMLFLIMLLPILLLIGINFFADWRRKNAALNSAS